MYCKRIGKDCRYADKELGICEVPEVCVPVTSTKYLLRQVAKDEAYMVKLLNKETDDLKLNLVKEDAQKIYDFLKSNVISMEIPHGGEPAEEDVNAVMWWQIQKYFKDNYDIGNYEEDI